MTYQTENTHIDVCPCATPGKTHDVRVHRTDPNPLGRLRATARLMREHHGPDHPRHAMWSAMAAWMDTAGADVWAHGPLCCDQGCDECDDVLWAPHARRALAVADAYLDISTPSAGGER